MHIRSRLSYQVVDDEDVPGGVAAVVEVALEAARREQHAHLRRLVRRVEVLRVALRARQTHNAVALRNSAY